MDCKGFNKVIYEYIENKLSIDLMKEADRHLEECTECRKLYEYKSSLKGQLAIAFDTRGAGLTSQRASILEKIDKDRYGKTPKHTLKTHFRVNWRRYASAAVAAVMVVIMLPMLPRIDNGISNLVAILRQAEPIVESELPIVADSLGIEDDGSIKILGGKDELNDVATFMNRGKRSNEMGGVYLPWQVMYSNPENLAIFNDFYLLLFKGDKYPDKLHSAINIEDIHKINPSDIDITSSPNGQFYILEINKRTDKVEKPEGNIYIVDMINKESRLLKKKDSSLYPANKVWSPSSRYFVLDDRKTITLYDLALGEEREINFTEPSNHDLFVSDEGSVLIASSLRGYIFNKKNYNKPLELEITGQPLGFNKDRVTFIDTWGRIYEKGSENTNLIYDFGKYTPVIQSNRYTYPRHNFYTVFDGGDSIKVFDTLNSKIENFKFKHDKSSQYWFTSDFKYMILDDGRIIDKDGNDRQIKFLNQMEQLYPVNYAGKIAVMGTNEVPFPGVSISFNTARKITYFSLVNKEVKK